MNNSDRRLAVFPGTFDPITNGHLDVIRRGAELFDELIVAIGENPDKRSMLDQAQRAQIAGEAAADIPNVRIAKYTGLTTDLVKSVGAAAILRGLRDMADLQREFQLALTNRAIAAVETVFIMTSPEFAFTSSTLVRQIAQMGGDLSALVPPAVISHLGKQST